MALDAGERLGVSSAVMKNSPSPTRNRVARTVAILLVLCSSGLALAQVPPGDAGADAATKATPTGPVDAGRDAAAQVVPTGPGDAGRDAAAQVIPTGPVDAGPASDQGSTPAGASKSPEKKPARESSIEFRPFLYALCSAYAALVLLSLWRLVWVPMRKSIQGAIKALTIEIESLAQPVSTEAVTSAKKLLDEARSQIDAKHWVWGWSGEYGMAAWNMYRRAELLMTSAWPQERIRAELVRMADELAKPARAAHANLLTALKGRLEASAPANDARDRNLLYEAMQVLQAEEEASESGMATRYNKTKWLVGGALLLLLLAGLGLGKPQFMLTGAVGGFLSRMGRAVQTDDDSPADDVRWPTHFLSPLLGALTGWSGLLVFQVLSTFHVLGDAFKDLSWDDANTLSMGMSLVFGFSERLFDSVVQKVEGKASAAPAGQAKVQPPPAA